ncbi:MAG: tetratricopeptide repeat protein [Thiolinea sp.]
MNVTTELLQLLSEVGYMACFRGDSERSQVIMDGVDAVGEEQAPIKMGLAIAKIYAGDLDNAVSILRDDVLAKEPEHMSAKCFLGIALNLKGDQDQASTLFEEVALKGSPDEQSIANVYLAN